MEEMQTGSEVKVKSGKVVVFVVAKLVERVFVCLWLEQARNEPGLQLWTGSQPLAKCVWPADRL